MVYNHKYNETPLPGERQVRGYGNRQARRKLCRRRKRSSGAVNELYFATVELHFATVELQFFTVELHFLPLNFKFLPLNFTFCR